jgi:hypothetical protein
VLSATDLAPPSDSDFLLLPVERTEDRLPSFGALPSNSLRVNFGAVSEWTEDGPLLRGVDGGSTTAVCGVAGVCFFGDKKPLNLLAVKLLLRLLGARLDGGLQLSSGSEDDSDVVEGELWTWPGTLAKIWGSLGCDAASLAGKGTFVRFPWCLLVPLVVGGGGDCGFM